MFSILIVADVPLFRKGICHIIQDTAMVSRCDEAENAKIAIKMLENHEYNIIIMDIQMQEMNDYVAIDIIRRRFPETMIIVVSIVTAKKEVLTILDKGVKGYILKSADVAEISKAFLYILEGNIYVSKKISNLWAQSGMKQQNDKRLECRGVEFSAREKEVIILICHQETNIEISQKLYISEHTVKNHRSNIMEKIGVHTSIGIVIYAIKAGLYKMDFEDSYF